MNDFDEGIQLATKLKCGINRNDKINCILQSQNKTPLYYEYNIKSY